MGVQSFHNPFVLPVSYIAIVLKKPDSQEEFQVLDHLLKINKIIAAVVVNITGRLLTMLLSFQYRVYIHSPPLEVFSENQITKLFIMKLKCGISWQQF